MPGWLAKCAPPGSTGPNGVSITGCQSTMPANARIFNDYGYVPSCIISGQPSAGNCFVCNNGYTWNGINCVPNCGTGTYECVNSATGKCDTACGTTSTIGYVYYGIGHDTSSSPVASDCSMTDYWGRYEPRCWGLSPGYSWCFQNRYLYDCLGCGAHHQAQDCGADLCSDSGNGNARCLPPPVNGICGDAAKTYTCADTSFSGSFCSSPIQPSPIPSFPSASSSVNWVCQGSNGGSPASCTASRASCLKADHQSCSSNAECLSGNCGGPNMLCVPSGYQCYFNSPSQPVTIGNPANGQDICTSDNSPWVTHCDSSKYCTTVGSYQCRLSGTSGLWTTPCSGTTPSCDSGTGTCKCTSTSCGSGKYCDANGVCQTSDVICTSGSYHSTECYSDTERKKCNSAGSGWIGESCSSGQGCEGNTCYNNCPSAYSGFCTNSAGSSAANSYDTYTAYCAGTSACIKCKTGYTKAGSAGSEYCITAPKLRGELCGAGQGDCVTNLVCNTHNPVAKTSHDGRCCPSNFYWDVNYPLTDKCRQVQDVCSIPCNNPSFVNGCTSGNNACCRGPFQGSYYNSWETITIEPAQS